MLHIFETLALTCLLNSRTAVVLETGTRTTMTVNAQLVVGLEQELLLLMTNWQLTDNDVG